MFDFFSILRCKLLQLLPCKQYALHTNPRHPLISFLIKFFLIQMLLLHLYIFLITFFLHIYIYIVLNLLGNFWDVFESNLE